jgi:hypothetical protein
MAVATALPNSPITNQGRRYLARRCGGAVRGRLRSFRVAENACHVMQVFHVFVAQN